jgi:hypothetical protein
MFPTPHRSPPQRRSQTDRSRHTARTPLRYDSRLAPVSPPASGRSHAAAASPGATASATIIMAATTVTATATTTSAFQRARARTPCRRQPLAARPLAACAPRAGGSRSPPGRSLLAHPVPAAAARHKAARCSRTPVPLMRVKCDCPWELSYQPAPTTPTRCARRVRVALLPARWGLSRRTLARSCRAATPPGGWATIQPVGQPHVQLTQQPVRQLTVRRSPSPPDCA